MSATVAGPVGAPFPNPLIPGFNPDPSVVLVDGVYHLVTSSFEYLPGLPVYRSTDFETWERIGNIATRAEQIAVDEVPTGLGVWAPTIRYRDGLFHVIVVVPAGRGGVVFTAEDPAGPWSDGLVLRSENGAGLQGIDPDLAWDEDGTAYVTYSGLILDGPDAGQHLGIQQVRVDLSSGAILEEPRSLWSGTGGGFPEAPHLYQRGSTWYLLIAEGGTERGHGVSIARGDAPIGPFETAPTNPFLTARGTTRPVQNTGHGDLVEGPDGSTLLVVLGVRPRGATRSFSALGRETFVTRVDWVDGWPVAEPVELAPRGPLRDDVDFSGPLDSGWIGVRRLPSAISTIKDGALVIAGEGRTLRHPQPTFVGRRQLTQTMQASVVVDVSGGTGGLAVRYDEDSFYAIEAESTGSGTRVTARAVIPSFEQEWTAELPEGPVTLVLESERDGGIGFGPGQMTSDFVVLRAEAGGVSRTLARVDGRYLTSETATSFTGRVLGLYAATGAPAFSAYRYTGTDD
ncbi:MULTISPECIES: glycoside hydrolase family 43 protein [unclassified Rathayibacter]|uniref:glycoside hydrolase family 43 protein n=1 Tax=unclassified Rathayibacter TaxID=2609250 RepID=UPI0006F3AD67|nr:MULTISPECIES: glycoside hydrolase family 43 protein [unclassified Rathayibacter]KQQ03647.1 glycoside hydrolase [Rathayibacter sp. Leaf294]KQS12103.1 glycoside hydrolase [Rathayibacter sp. Leaf185]